MKYLDQIENIHLTKQRFAAIWAGTSLLDMMSNAMREMLHLKWNFDFFVNLSGADYLLKHPKYFKKYLRKNMGKNFVWNVRNNVRKNKKGGFLFTFKECGEHLYNLGPRSLPKGAKFVQGSDWIILSKAFIGKVSH